VNEVDVEVDGRLCAGSTWCLTVAPGAFEIGPTGRARPLADVSASREQLAEAEESCPVGAIRVSISADKNAE
jgi:ferredoxin